MEPTTMEPTTLQLVQAEPARFFALDKPAQLGVLIQLIDLSGSKVELLDPVRAIATLPQRRLLVDLLVELDYSIPAPTTKPYGVRAQEAHDLLNRLID